MIYGLEVSDPARSIVPWWKDVPFLQGKKQIEFNPGLTLVFGPNGSGKSTILVAIAKALCAWQGGVSKLTEASIGDYRERSIKEKGLLDGVLPNHDGRGVLFIDPTKAPGVHSSYIDDEFGFEQIRDMLASRASAGQVTLGRVQGLFESIEDPSLVPFPDTSFALRSMNDLWMDWAKRIEQILRGSGPLPPSFLQPEPKGKKPKRIRPVQSSKKPEPPKRGPDPRIPTIILDEPDRSLSIPWAANLWANLASKVDKDKIQIIAATHCPFAIDLPGVTYLETEPGYLDKCRIVYRQVGKRIETK
jgi:energy-coupling factor transporter ATP-binding protein EcfA2